MGRFKDGEGLFGGGLAGWVDPHLLFCCGICEIMCCWELLMKIGR